MFWYAIFVRVSKTEVKKFVKGTFDKSVYFLIDILYVYALNVV